MEDKKRENILKEDNFKSLIERFAGKRKQKFPLTASVEITKRCNLRCKFCYLDSQKNLEPDMPKKKLFHIVNQLEDFGCMKLLLIGGEVFLRKDYLKIYEYLKRRGFLVRVVTNGTLINEEIVNMFKEMPPHELRISVFAGSPAGYKKITGSSKAYNKLINNVKILKQKNIKFYFHYLLTRINASEILKIKKKAKELDIPFQLSSRLLCNESGDRFVKRLKITSQQKEKLKNYNQFRRWINYDGKIFEDKKCSGVLYITNDCKLRICPVIKNKEVYNLDQVELKKALNNRLNKKIVFNCPTF